MAKNLSSLHTRPKGRPTSFRKGHSQQHQLKLMVELEKGARSTKISTGKYNMNVLREISQAEEAALRELVMMYQVDSEDNLPVSFDVHQVLDMDESERAPFLMDMLKGCPAQGVSEFVDGFLGRIKGLSPFL